MNFLASFLSVFAFGYSFLAWSIEDLYWVFPLDEWAPWLFVYLIFWNLAFAFILSAVNVITGRHALLHIFLFLATILFLRGTPAP